MTLSEIAADLVESCRSGTESDMLARLYADTAVSVEPRDMGEGREAVGLDAIRAKHAWWADNATVHSAEVEGPFLHGDDRFAVIFRIDTTMFGERSQMAEVGIYTVADGRIVREEFYYGG
jgi:ketosteroid isomerase-like protein